MEEEKTILFRLRDTARICADVLQRKLMSDLANDLDEALIALFNDPTDHNMRRVNGMWSKAARLIAANEPCPPSRPRGGAEREGARLAA